jgi:hypothetical protein
MSQKRRRLPKPPLQTPERDVSDARQITQEQLDEILREHELMRKTLETIAANSADRLQATQARGALTNIGPTVTPRRS